MLKTSLLITFLCIAFIGQAQVKEDERYKIVNAIYQNLLKAKGKYDLSKPPPKLKIVESEESAYYDKDENIIVVSYRLYALLEQLGEHAPDAIAFVLGHELAHYYQNHPFNKRCFITTKALFSQSQKEEGEADVQGAFLAYLAGYQPSKVVPRLLDSIYKSYDLIDMNTYPSLAKRKAVDKTKMNIVKELINCFESANYWLAATGYSEAMCLYKYINNHFSSAAIYNNMALVEFRQALSNMDESKDRVVLRFTYPFELDLDFRLYSPRTKGRRDDIFVHLRNSEFWLKKALELDSNYAPALLHKACVYDVMEYFGMAKEQNALDVIACLEGSNYDANTKAKTLIVKGIIFSRDPQITYKSEQFFAEAKGYATQKHLLEVADYNNGMLGSKKLRPKSLDIWGTKPKNVLPDPCIDYYSNPPDWDQQFEQNDTIISFKQSPNNLCMEIQIGKESAYSLQRVQKGQAATNKGIRIGDSRALVRSKMGNPTTTLLSDKGYYFTYIEDFLIFQFEEDKVKEWAIFY